ncbi:MAG: PEGA domain-containing protein, partial [Myxococcota bacterium]
MAIDEGISPAMLETIGNRLREALGHAGEIEVRYGALDRLEPGDGAVGDHLLNAGELLRQGEDLYMGSEYAPAAASLAESAVLYTNALARLSAEDISRLYRAHLLAGLAWIEAGQRDQAKAAFKKLLTIRPDLEPDPELMPPHGRVVFREALSEIRATGLRSLVIRTDPEGAEVLIDGLARGKTPITLTGLPVGTHGLRLVLAGYQTVEADVVLPATEQQSEYGTELHQTLRMAAYQRVRTAVRQGKAVDDVAEDIALLAAVVSPQVVFVGAARAEVGWVVVARRWHPVANETSAAYAVLESLDDLAPLDDLARLLLKSTWPAIHVPPDAEP